MVRKMAIAYAITVVACVAPPAADARTPAQRVGACADADVIAVDKTTRRRAIAGILCEVNRARATHQVRALRASKSLARAARGHSAAMVSRRSFAHRFPGGNDVRRRAQRSGYLRPFTAALLGETLAWGLGAMASPAQLVASFMKSPTHRRTMLANGYRDLGIGLALGAPRPVANAATTLTLDFGRRN